MNDPSDESIVLVGSGAVLPTPRETDLWSAFEQGIDAGRDLPPERLRLRGAALDRWRDLGLEMPRSWRGYTAATPAWDAQLAASCSARLGEADAEALDRSSRYALAAALQAWDSAEMAQVDRRRVACMLGSIALPTEASAALFEQVQVVPLLRRLGLPVHADNDEGDWHAANHWAMSLPVLVVRQALGLGGDAAAIDAACASSLYAVSRGCELLRRNVADAVLVGGTSGADRLYTQLGFSALQALSRSGRCSPFDQRADGLVVGEGAAVFVLKREADALRHGDRLIARVAGCGLSNDREGGLLAPSAEGQLRALRGAYREAGVAPQDVDLIECHATGTPLGDAVEVASLSRLLAGRQPTRPIALGAAKANVGHLLTGAGAAGLYRLLLALENRVLPPVANFEQARDKLGIEHGPLRILREADEWVQPRTRPRRAAVSAFGFGGINAHIVLEEWRDPTPPTSVAVGSGADSRAAGAVVESVAVQEVSASPLRQSGSRGDGDGPEILVTGVAAQCGSADDEALRSWLLWNRPPEDWCPELTDITVDLQRFRIPPRELTAAMGQQLISLELARAALIDSGAIEAGAQRDAHWLRDGDVTGVFAACDLDPSTNDFASRWAVGAHVLADVGSTHDGTAARHPDLPVWIDRVCPPLDADRTLGSLGGIVASRVAREFGCGGPSYVVACGGLSGLQALDAACEALRAGRIERAIVVGVDLARDARQGTLRSLSTAYGPAASCRPLSPGSRNAFDADQAVALILETSNRVDRSRGRYGSLEVRAADEMPLRATELGGDGWLETAACGDPRRDAMLGERAAAAASAGAGVGAIAGTLGLAEAVGGLLGVYRTLLAHRAGRQPASLEQPAGEELLLSPAPAEVAVDFSCSLAGLRQVLVREPGLEHVEPGPDAGAVGAGLVSGLFVFEGEAGKSLADQIVDLQQFAEKASGDSVRVAELAAQWNARRPPHDGAGLRLAFLVRDHSALEVTLRGLLAKGIDVADCPTEQLPQGVVRGRVDPEQSPKVAFVYPGSGQLASWQGAEVLEQLPGTLKRLRSRHPELRELLAAPAGQPAEGPVADQILRQVTTSLALHEVLVHCGVEPAAVLGYSVGETAALMGCRVWRDQAGLIDRMRRSSLFREDLAGQHRAARTALGWPTDQAFEWKVAVVSTSPESIRSWLHEDGAAARSVRLLVINSDEECLIGGDHAELESFADRHDLQLHALADVAAVHSDLAAPCARAYHSFHSLECAPGRVAVYGTASGVPYSPTQQTCAESLTRQAIEGFDFRRLVRNAWQDGYRIFVEVGPGTSCTRMIRRILDVPSGSPTGGPDDALAVALSRENGCSGHDLLRLLGRLWVRGVSVELEAVLAGAQAEPPPEHQRSVAVRRTVDSEGLAAALGVGSAEHSVQHAASGSPEQAPSAEGRSAASPATGAELHDGVAAPSSRNQAPELGVDPAGAGSPVAAASDAQLAAEPPRQLDREQCLQFARGTLAPVFGPRFAEVDSFPTRVRLPDEPLMLVDRITAIEGEPLSLQGGRVVTEHDVLRDGWYLDEGVLPTAIAVESGQADLLLSGFLGIDFETRGIQRYRLLDAVVTFHDALPEAGQVVRYDIHIDHFFHQGANWLFRFGFEATVEGRPLLTMRDGCAGFFSEADLAAGQGIVRARLEQQGTPGQAPPDALLDWSEEELGRREIEAVLVGDLERAFGRQFAELPMETASTLPGGLLDLVDRVTRMERLGGRYGLGLVEAEHDVTPDAWFLTCHFVDDQVMPGTLMYECCLHALRIFLLRSGWVAEKGTVRWQPVPGVASRLRCRGQVTAETRVAGYRVEIKEMGERPEPYVVADATLLADGREIVAISDLTLQLTGVTFEALRELWRPAAPDSTPDTAEPDGDAGRRGTDGGGGDGIRLELAPAVYDRSSVEQFASGRPSLAFGDAYLPFDEERKIARLPRDPYQFLDAVVAVEGEPFVLRAGARCTAQWRVRPEHWYFDANRQPTMPFAVLLEAALQPCGWLAAYCGSALTSDQDLSFRNLGGDATLHAMPVRQDDLLSTEVELTRTSASGGMIIQHFDLSVESAVLGPLYSGTTYFGFFPAEALANQVGLKDCPLWPSARMLAPGARLPGSAPFPTEQWRMVDRIVCCSADGGEHDQGHVRGTIDVDPAAWFFEAHFYQDPVWPGSLGLEAVLQLLRYWVREQFDGAATPAGPVPDRFDPAVVGHRHRWSYRGQIVPRDRLVTVEASVRGFEVDPATGEGVVMADGIVEVDGRVIYRLLDFAVSFGQGTPLRPEESE